MSPNAICTMVISSQVSSDEIEALKTSVEMSSIDVQKPQDRIVGVDDVVFVFTVLVGIKEAAELVEFGVKLAKKINNWRRKLRESGKEVKGKLEYPNRPTLDLNTATDQEIEAWLSQQ